jgi:hypothetical protein
MYFGVKSVVWRSDAIPQVGLDVLSGITRFLNRLLAFEHGCPVELLPTFTEQVFNQTPGTDCPSGNFLANLKTAVQYKTEFNLVFKFFFLVL